MIPILFMFIAGMLILICASAILGNQSATPEQQARMEQYDCHQIDNAEDAE